MGGKLGHENLSHTTNEQEAECTQICTSADTATMFLINLNLSVMPSPVVLIVIHQKEPSRKLFPENFSSAAAMIKPENFPEPPTPWITVFQSWKGMSNESRYVRV